MHLFNLEEALRWKCSEGLLFQFLWVALPSKDPITSHVIQKWAGKRLYLSSHSSLPRKLAAAYVCFVLFCFVLFVSFLSSLTRTEETYCSTEGTPPFIHIWDPGCSETYIPEVMPITLV